MKALVYTGYGSAAVLRLTEVPRPEPREDQVLVKVHAASANALDYRSVEEVSPEAHPGSKARRSGNKVLGADISGQVEAIGASVKQFRPGDQVFGVSAGLRGGFAECACAAEDHLALPDRLAERDRCHRRVPVQGRVSLAVVDDDEATVNGILTDVDLHSRRKSF
jgi:NADPH:quinone reductase-like Zn-dependent oxidoreductase